MKKIVPDDHLLPDSFPAESPDGSGTGLNGLYFWYSDLTGAQYYQLDPEIDFDWGEGNPPGVSPNFSIRWEGKVQAEFTETYTFYLTFDDGARLWVNGQKLIDVWSYTGQEHSGTISLIAGHKYDIVVEFHEIGGNANIKLRWSSPSQPKEIVPQSQLSPNDATPTQTFTATKTYSPTATKTYTPTSTPVFNPPSGQVWKFYYYAGAQKVAVRVAGDPNSGANGVFYTLGDHLGSTSLITNASGGKVAESRYMPWGETRFTTGPAPEACCTDEPGPLARGDGGFPSPRLRDGGFGATLMRRGYQPSDYLYTGQREDSYIKLYQMGARWYDPALGRFTQPDTIIPVAEQGIQAWDRYAYVNNNPIRHVDPSGHNCAEYDMSGHIVNICNLGNWWSDPSNSIGISLDGTYNITWKYGIEEPKSLPNYPKNIFGGVTCNLSLPECFGDIVYLQDFSEYDEDNPIPIDEFEQFADKVAEDLHTHNIDWPGYNSGRQIYDTPFYNGGESERRTGNPNSESGIYPSDQQVCIETIGCYGRSDINYIAQGMWGAAVGEPKFISIGIVKAWKYEEYGESPSEATLFWLNYGYDYYLQWLENNE